MRGIVEIVARRAFDLQTLKMTVTHHPCQLYVIEELS